MGVAQVRIRTGMEQLPFWQEALGARERAGFGREPRPAGGDGAWCC